MRGTRRTLSILLTVLMLALPALAASGCGAVGHAIGGAIAHRAANHLLGRRTAGKVFCLYHGHRVLVDLRQHHLVGAALNAYFAYHSCRTGFGRRH